jgi:glycosyltransferase involved in cell wall biosynthesis
LLLVSCHFPPDPTVGALRWHKLARFAAERGWALDVIMTSPSELAKRDDAALRDLPPGTRLFEIATPSRPLFAIQLAAWRLLRRTIDAVPGRGSAEAPSASGSNGKATFSPGNGTAGDSAIDRIRRAYLASAAFRAADAWASRAVAVGRELVRRHDLACVVSSGPPHVAHEAARQIALATHRPFVMDMRDPWFDVEAMPVELRSDRWLALAERYERRCVGDASLVVLNTAAAEQAMRERYSDLGDRAMTAMNGADDDPLPPVIDTGRFVIAFAGTLYVGRNPRTLFEALAQVVADLRLTPDQIGVEFMGSENAGDTPLLQTAAELGLENYFRCYETRPRADALRFFASATMLVNLAQDVRRAVPAKLFEYVRFPAWLLLLTEPDTASAVVFRETAADVVSPQDVSGIARVIRSRYEEYRIHGRPPALNADGRFDRRRQATLLLDAIDRVTTAGPFGRQP